MKKWIVVTAALLFNVSAYAADNSEVKNTCEVSGGTWTESGNNWACCWSDWGCYGCVNGICKIKCHNQRCRDANQIRPDDVPRKNYYRIEGLAPSGSIAPVLPKPKKALKTPAADSLR